MSDNPILKTVQIIRRYPDDLQSHFVQSLVIQHQPDYFVLSFFEVWPPPILGETEAEKHKLLEELDNIEAKCVARLVVTPDRMEEFLRLITENYSKYANKA